MANQPRLRPWSRLASLRSAPAPPAPQLHPPSALPTFKTASTAPTHPSQSSELTAGAAARASLNASQARNTSSPYNNANATKSLPTTTPAADSPIESQNLKLIKPPPSSLAMQPSRLNVNHDIEPKIPVEEEPKTVLVNKTIEKPNGNGNGSLHNGLNKKLPDSDDSGVRVITIAGENKGAYMEIIQSRKKPNHLHKMGNSETYESEKSVSGEGCANKGQKVRTVTSPPMSGVYMNNNVQCVNSSLLLDTSCTHHDPGVRLTLSKNPFREGFHLKEQRN